MAENKYDLLLVPTKDNSRIRHQPWYKERLNMKYTKPLTKKDWKPRLAASSWTFIKDGVDDFRDGKPPPKDTDLLIKGSKGLEPNLFGIDPDSKRKPKQNISKQLPKDEAVFQKELPLQRRRRKRIEEIETVLLEHPLALYPHYEDSVPTDLFEEIVTLLDPALSLNNEVSETSLKSAKEEDDLKSNATDDIFNETRGKPSRELCTGYKDAIEGVSKKQYKWLQEQVEVNREERIKTLKKRQESPTQETGIDEVTKEFCDWVRNLGGQSNNIEESTIYSLFASGYETKPALSVPIHVVELTNVPPELRTGNVGPSKESAKQKSATVEQTEPTYTPSWVKKYHSAWYLDPKKWTANVPPEGLQDPKENKEQKMTESKKKSNDLDKVLATLHGARAFKDFVDTKKTRRPEFLESVAKHQEEIAAEASEEATVKDGTSDTRSRTLSRRTMSPKSRANSTFD
eukprot:Seg167.1 transcript_id=Seg167.1/GoldUCD/mRNA.D3Y31 product="Protein FAM47E" protein_id=Seg167.1/GoldUCD/D3Y31